MNLTLAANTIRGLAMDGVQKANSGHPGMPMGCAEFATVLWLKFLKHDPADPKWADRDRFVLSAGHGSMLLYSMLHLSGYPLPIEQLQLFRQLDSRTPGHPEFGHTVGVETTTGPLGAGLSNAVGMALAEAMLAAKFNKDGQKVVDHYTYAIAGDGCMMEGISHEACSLAGHLGLNKLVVFYDYNEITMRHDHVHRCNARNYTNVQQLRRHSARPAVQHHRKWCCSEQIGIRQREVHTSNADIDRSHGVATRGNDR